MIIYEENKQGWLDYQAKEFKKYTKQNPLKKRIRLRSKKGPITVEKFFTSFPRKQKGSFSFLHPELKGVKLKVTATLDSWKKLESFTLDHPDWFGLEFHSRFAEPVVLEISEKNKPRGRQKKIYHCVYDIKIHAGVLYAFFSYWSKRSVKEWPDYLKNLIEKAEKDDYLISPPGKKGRTNRLVEKLMRKGTNTPYRMTRYCIEKVYREEINELKLKLFGDPANFKQTYIYADRRAARFTKFFSIKSPQEVTTFASTMAPLKYIFETLKVL